MISSLEEQLLSNEMNSLPGEHRCHYLAKVSAESLELELLASPELLMGKTLWIKCFEVS